MKHQIMYKGKGKLVLLYNVPEPPPVMASINADTLAMNAFNIRMKFIEKHALNVSNPEVLTGLFELHEDNVFDLPDYFKIHISGNDVVINASV
jgi:hypothetical protein